MKIGLGGDLMIGRLVDEYLDTHPFSHIWGNLHPILKETDFNLVNLEAALTRSETVVPKVFNFKAKPEKAAVLSEGPIHCVNLANNHILDYGEEGLLETLQVLDNSHILHVGAGKNADEAKAPCILEKEGLKIGILGCTDNESAWEATALRPGTFFAEVGDVEALQKPLAALRNKVDILILSMHWGPNMRQRPLPHFRNFAHRLIDLGVDIFHGHSAHIFQGVEAYKNRLILYDTGDFVDDYAIDPILRNDLSFFFIATIKNRKLTSLKMIPSRISNFQVNISHERGHLERMEKLCMELNTSLSRENNTLVLSFS